MSPESQQPIIIHPPVHGEDIDPGVADVIPAGPTTSAALPVTIRQREAPGATTAEVSRVSPAPPELAAPDSKRAFGLDALRGLFLLSMTLGFTVRSEHFPLWMYHRQFPPPGDTLVDIAGISWRDLAYGAFLFTMAAALPLTLSRRIEKRETEIGILAASVRRYLVLLFFALLIAHSNPFFLGYTRIARVLAIVGFGIMAMIFTRRRKDWDEQRYRILNNAGWILGVVFLALSPLLYGKTFSFARNDEIIAGLAFASLAGSVIWYFTRDNIPARLAVLGMAIALYLGARGDGWIQEWWDSSPFEWAFVPNRFVLLAVVIPGTIVGDIVLRWMRSADRTNALAHWSHGRIATLAAVSAVFTPILVVGLYNRAVLLTTQAVLAFVVAGLFLVHRPATPTERMLRSLFLWGAVWMTIGLFLEPFEGGIKKAPDTLTYFFTITGSTTMLLVSLTAIVDGLRRAKLVSTLVDIGHNPLLTYVIYTVLLNSVFDLIPGSQRVLTNSNGEFLLRMLIETTIVVLLVRDMSRRRIYWRT